VKPKEPVLKKKKKKKNCRKTRTCHRPEGVHCRTRRRPPTTTPEKGNLGLRRRAGRSPHKVSRAYLLSRTELPSASSSSSGKPEAKPRKERLLEERKLPGKTPGRRGHMTSVRNFCNETRTITCLGSKEGSLGRGGVCGGGDTDLPSFVLQEGIFRGNLLGMLYSEEVKNRRLLSPPVQGSRTFWKTSRENSQIEEGGF